MGTLIKTQKESPEPKRCPLSEREKLTKNPASETLHVPMFAGRGVELAQGKVFLENHVHKLLVQKGWNNSHDLCDWEKHKPGILGNPSWQWPQVPDRSQHRLSGRTHGTPGLKPPHKALRLTRPQSVNSWRNSTVMRISRN